MLDLVAEWDEKLQILANRIARIIGEMLPKALVQFPIPEISINPEEPPTWFSVIRHDLPPEEHGDTHIRCWRKYKVRPPGGSPNPQETDWKYCIYDKMHKDYGYTQAWVDFLIEKLNDPTEFDSLSIVAGRAGESSQSQEVTHA